MSVALMRGTGGSSGRPPGYAVSIKLSVVGDYAILFSPGLVGRPQGVE